MSLTQHLWSQLTGGAILPPKPTEPPVIVIPTPAGLYRIDTPNGTEILHHDESGYWQHIGTVRQGEGFTDDEIAAYLRVIGGGQLDLLVKHRDADQ